MASRPVVSSNFSDVRQTTRLGYGAGGVPYTGASYHRPPSSRSGSNPPTGKAERPSIT